MPRGGVTVVLIAWTLANAGISVTLYRIGGRPPAAPDARAAVVVCHITYRLETGLPGRPTR